jgi:hypothetical protein
MIIGWSNGGTIVMPRSAANSSARALRSSDVVPAKTTSARRRHHDHGWNAQMASGQRDGLAMIAGRVRNHAALQLLIGELRNHVVGAADLEGAHGLEVLALQEQRPGS